MFVPDVWGSQKRALDPFDWMYGWSWTAMRVLGAEPESSKRTTNTLICWAISAAHIMGKPTMLLIHRITLASLNLCVSIRTQRLWLLIVYVCVCVTFTHTAVKGQHVDLVLSLYLVNSGSCGFPTPCLCSRSCLAVLPHSSPRWIQHVTRNGRCLVKLGRG